MKPCARTNTVRHVIFVSPFYELIIDQYIKSTVVYPKIVQSSHFSFRYVEYNKVTVMYVPNEGFVDLYHMSSPN